MLLVLSFGFQITLFWKCISYKQREYLFFQTGGPTHRERLNDWTWQKCVLSVLFPYVLQRKLPSCIPRHDFPFVDVLQRDALILNDLHACRCHTWDFAMYGTVFHPHQHVMCH